MVLLKKRKKKRRRRGWTKMEMTEKIGFLGKKKGFIFIFKVYNFYFFKLNIFKI